jgi:hypothetical protein
MKLLGAVIGGAYRIGTLLIVLAGWIPGTVEAKTAVDFNVALAFPDQGKQVGAEVVVISVPTFAKAWDQVVLTARPVTAVDSPVPSSSEQVVMTGRVEKLRAELNSSRGELAVPVTIRAEGEYLLTLEFEFRQGEAVTGKGRISVGVLAEGGKVWFGRESIEMAFVEKTKTDLGIKGQPEGAKLTELNRRWETWLKTRERQIRERDRDRDRDRRKAGEAPPVDPAKPQRP